MQRYRILWVDDEIELLKPYVLFLREKGFDIKTFNNPFSIVITSPSFIVLPEELNLIFSNFRL